MASNSQNPHLQRKDGGPEVQFSVTVSELALLGQMFGHLPAGDVTAAR